MVSFKDHTDVAARAEPAFSIITDTMDKWSDEKLQEVVGAKGNSATTTDIVCKHFIDAVESERYGWFWTCPDEVGGETGVLTFFSDTLLTGAAAHSTRLHLQVPARFTSWLRAQEPEKEGGRGRKEGGDHARRILGCRSEFLV